MTLCISSSGSEPEREVSVGFQKQAGVPFWPCGQAVSVCHCFQERTCEVSMYKVQRERRDSHSNCPHILFISFVFLPPALANLPVQPQGPPGTTQPSIGPSLSTGLSSTESRGTIWQGTGFLETAQHPFAWPHGPQCCLPF